MRALKSHTFSNPNHGIRNTGAWQRWVMMDRKKKKKKGKKKMGRHFIFKGVSMVMAL